MKSITELREERQRRRLSQTDAARIMGTTQSALSRAERDGNPTQDFLQRYERALDTTAPQTPSMPPAQPLPSTTTSSGSFGPLEIATIRLIVAKLVAQYDIVEMYVFGSVARGDERPDSDVDLLYRFAPGASHSMMTMRQLTNDLERALGRKVSLTSYDSLLRSAQRSRASRRFLGHIREDMVKVA